MKHKIFTLIMLLSIVPLGASELRDKQEIFLDIPQERSRNHDRERSRSRERSLSVEVVRATGKCLSLTAVLAKLAIGIISLVGTCVN